MGFIVYSTYAIKNHRSAAEYFGKLFTQNNVTDISNLSRRYSVITQYYSVLDKDHLKWHIKNTELYFDDIMGKVYDEYNTYYEEITSIDDEE